MARDTGGSNSARRLLARARATPLAHYVGLSLVVHGAALGWLAREHFAPAAAIDPPRVRFQLRLASVAASQAATEAPPEDVLRPREVPLERQRTLDVSPPPRPVTDRASLARTAHLTPAPRAEAPVGRVARTASEAPPMAPPRQVVEPLRDVAALRRVEREVPLEPRAITVVSASSVDNTAAEGEARPDTLHSPQPEYPRLARLRGWEGTCVLLARVGVDGCPLELTVLESAGRAVLDEAALAGVRRWRFEPARAHGRAVESTARIPVTFRIRR